MGGRPPSRVRIPPSPFLAETLRIAHRGYPGAGARENSLDAIEGALALGCDMVEIDVRRRRDGALVLDHDDGDQPGAPLLADALVAIRNAGRLANLDLKLATIGAQVTATVREAGMLERTTCTGCDWAALAAIQRAEPAMRIGLTVPRRGSEVPRPLRSLALPVLRWHTAHSAIRLCRRYGADLITLHHGLVSRAMAAAMHGAGYQVWCWTVDEPDELARVRSAGVDGICSDLPASHGL